jgi:putative transcriptional regulator
MVKAYKSDAMAAIHETMEGFYESGIIDKQTMREFDEACLTSVEALTSEEIPRIISARRATARERKRYENENG